MKKQSTAEFTPKKQALIDEKNASPITVGERIGVKRKILSPKYADSLYKGEKGEKVETATVLEVLPKNKIKIIEGDGSYRYTSEVIKIKDIDHRDISMVGANPISKDQDEVRTVAFSFDSIIFGLNLLSDKIKPVAEGEKLIEGFNTPFKIGGVPIEECNWNPFVYGKDGKKNYFQRSFVWNNDDNRNLIDSIYQRIDCGRILIRKRSYNELEKMAKSGEKELFWQDIIDGKQRLNAVRLFLQGKFADSQGNYFNDLSYVSQNKFTSHQLFGYSEMPDDSSDESVIRQFLKLNFCGVPQSKEHIEFVKSIQKNI